MGLLGQLGRFRGRYRRALLTTFGLASAVLALGPAASGIAAGAPPEGGTVGPSAPVSTIPAGSNPSVMTGPSDQVTYQSAQLRGQVNSGGLTTSYFFLYGPTSAYGSQTLPASLVAGDGPVTVYSQITGLLPLTEYHYSLVAINALGTRFGADQTFTTAAAPLDLTISASANPDVLDGPVSIVGSITGTGSAGSAVVLQENPFPFTAGFQLIGVPGLASATGSFSFDVGPVPVTTQFRVVSVGSGEPVVSDTLTEFVQIGVTMNVARTVTRSGRTGTTFSGVITPAEVGARVSVQRQVGSKWVLVAATTSQAAAAPGDSTYTITLHPVHSGRYRVFAASVEGGHLANSTQAVVVHVHGALIPSG
jgi:hypothetical protein